MKKILILLLITFSLSSLSANQYRCEDFIYNAVQKRNLYYKSIIPLNRRNKAYNNPDTWINVIRPTNNPWYFFLRGVYNLKSGSSGSANFRKALEVTEGNIGDLWLLFVEFEKIDQREWSDLTIERIHKALTTSGSSVAPTIVSQLMILARQSDSKNNKSNASYYVQTALKFTKTTTPILATAYLNGIQPGEHKITPVTLVSSFFDELKSNWQIQTHVIKGVFIFTKGFIYVSTIILFLLILIKYYPKVVHTLVCRYPLSVPYKIRLSFISILILPFLFFGGYVGALITSFALLIYIDSKHYKRLIGLVIIGFLLFPVLNYPEAAIDDILSENTVHSLYYQSINEIPSEDLRKKIVNWKKSGTDENSLEKSSKQKALLLTAEAIVIFKQQSNQNMAEHLINKALKLEPDFQPTLIAASVINQAGNNPDAKEYFESAIEKFPKLAEVHYNYNRYKLESNLIEHTDENLNKAMSLSKEKIQEQTDLNTLYYGESTPPVTRRYFISTMDSKTFWENRKDLIGSSATKATKLWGNTFFGFNPLQSTLILSAIFVILLIRIISTSSKRSSISKCSLCGRPTCRNCKCAEYCNECNTLMKSISNESLIESMKIKISINKRLTARIIGISLQMLFPGSAAFFINGKPPLKAFPILFITLLVYTVYVVLFSYSFSLFPEKSLFIKLLILGILSLYNIFFILQFFSSLKHEKNAGKA